MGSGFEHDATPTWSGFIYQGYVAVYIAVSKICELLPDNMDKQEIGSTYFLEVENWEDVAVVCDDGKEKNYISIHQVKNINKESINDYKKPIIQLMLERNYLKKKKWGIPKAYLHISKQVKEDENQISGLMQNWEGSVIDYYNQLKYFHETCIDESDKANFQQQVRRLIEKEPIGLNRKKYNDLLNNIKQCIKEDDEVEHTKEQIKELVEYLKKELAVPGINAGIELYQYDADTNNCDAKLLYKKIVEKVKEYKKIINSQEELTEEQYGYIADKLLGEIRKHILDRHWRKQKKMESQSQFSFQTVMQILDDSVSDYETKANIMALRRIYTQALSEYCEVICENACEGGDDYKCRLLNKKYGKVDMDDEEFKRMCFAYNPNCDKKIEDRLCINELLNRDGLQDSVFEVYKNISDKYFIGKDDARIVVNDQNNNAFLTAIAHNRNKTAVSKIVRGISNNAELVSPIFEADELITVHLDSGDEPIWDCNYDEISEKYMEQQMIEGSDDNRNSICYPKKPKFVKAQDVIERLT